jgi:hypothetical protein
MQWAEYMTCTEEMRNGYKILVKNRKGKLLASIGIIESRRMQWAEYVTCTEEMRNVYKILVKNRKGKRLFTTLISKWSLKREGGCELDSPGTVHSPVEASNKYDSEP